MPTDELTPEHEETLAKSAIDIAMAKRWRVRSILSPTDLPDGAEELGSHVPGILFPLPDIHGHTLDQIRADTTPANQGKYRFPSGNGNILVCWPIMQNHLDTKDYDHVVLVEGTKQCLALSCLNPPKTLILGISGCFGWQSSEEADGVVEGLASITAGKSVYVIFDADVRSNDMVHDAATRLHEYLIETANASSVQWILLKDSSSKEGIDDYLAKYPPDSRLKAYRELVRRALKKVPVLRQPGAPLPKSQALVPNEEQLAFTKLITSKDGEVIGEEVVFNALVRITETMSVKNDLVTQADGSPKSLGARATLEVRSHVLGEDSVYITIPYDELDDFKAWTQRLPWGAAFDLMKPVPGRPTVDLVNAILHYRADEKKIVNGYARLGWTMHQEQPHFLYSGGAIGPDGTTTAVRGVLEGPASKVRFPDLGEIDKDTLKEAVRASFSPIKFLHRPELWKVLVGAVSFVSAGFEPKGMLFFFGEPGSGKTHLAQGATSFYSPNFSPEHEIMATLEGTDNAITNMVVGFHNALILFDDAHPVKSQSKREKQYEVIDSLSRISYSGGSANKARARWDTRGQVMRHPEMSMDRPFIMITAEFQPYGEDARSQLERMFLIRIRESDTFYSYEEVNGEIYDGLDEPLKGSHALEQLGVSGKLNTAMAGYLQWIANKIADYAKSPSTALTDWREGKIKELVASIAPDFMDENVRLRENVRTYMVGWILWLEYALDIGAISAEEEDVYLESFRVELRILMDEYKTSALDKTSYGFQQIIDGIIAREAAGELVIARSWSNDDDGRQRGFASKSNAVVVGSYIKARKGRGDGVALSMELLAQALHQDKTLLAQMLDRNGVEKNYPFSLNGKTVRGWFFPRHLWEGEGMSGETDDDESTSR